MSHTVWEYSIHAYVDNEAMLHIFKTGRHPTMRHLGRFHNAAISWIHELYNSRDVAFAYASSDGNPANIFTTALDSAPFAVGRARAVCTVITSLDTVIDPTSAPRSAGHAVGVVAISLSVRTSFEKVRITSRWPHPLQWPPTTRDWP